MVVRAQQHHDVFAQAQLVAHLVADIEQRTIAQASKLSEIKPG